jgi:hypothetical protein
MYLIQSLLAGLFKKHRDDLRLLMKQSSRTTNYSTTYHLSTFTPSELQLFNDLRRINERTPLLNILSPESGVASNCVKTFFVTANNEYAGLVLDRESRLPSRPACHDHLAKGARSMRKLTSYASRGLQAVRLREWDGKGNRRLRFC